MVQISTKYEKIIFKFVVLFDYHKANNSYKKGRKTYNFRGVGVMPLSTIFQLYRDGIILESNREYANAQVC